jgi:hypothetical protein
MGDAFSGSRAGRLSRPGGLRHGDCPAVTP